VTILVSIRLGQPKEGQQHHGAVDLPSNQFNPPTTTQLHSTTTWQCYAYWVDRHWSVDVQIRRTYLCTVGDSVAPCTTRTLRRDSTKQQHQVVYSGRFGGSIHSLRLSTQIAYSGRFGGSIRYFCCLYVLTIQQHQVVYSGRFGGSIHSSRLSIQTTYSGRFGGSIRCFALHTELAPDC